MDNPDKKPPEAKELSMEEFLALSYETRRQARAKFYTELIAELDRIMPEAIHWSVRLYYCRICGGAVFNRVHHLRYHRGTDMVEVLTTLFGRP